MQLISTPSPGSPRLAHLAWLAPALLIGTLALVPAAHAQSTITQYDSRTSFDAATSGLTTFNFNGYAPADDSTQYPTGLTVQGVTFTASPDQLFVDDPGDGNGDPFNGSQYLDTDNTQPLNIVLPAGTTAFGADFSNYSSPYGTTITALVNGMTFTFAEPDGNSSVFAGFTSLVPITSLSFSSANISNSSRGVALDNVSYGKASPAVSAAPEPSALATLAMSVLGLGGLVLRARKKVRAA